MTAPDNCTVLPDGSAFAMASYPLPKNHWLYAPREYEPGAEEPKELPHPILTHAHRAEVVAAVRYAIRGATMCGKEKDFDPDALVQSAVYAFCGPFKKNSIPRRHRRSEGRAIMTADTEALSRDEWSRRYAARIAAVAGWDQASADAAAEAVPDEYIGDYDSPEEAADDEMSHWEDDGDE